MALLEFPPLRRGGRHERSECGGSCQPYVRNPQSTGLWRATNSPGMLAFCSRVRPLFKEGETNSASPVLLTVCLTSCPLLLPCLRTLVWYAAQPGEISPGHPQAERWPSG